MNIDDKSPRGAWAEHMHIMKNFDKARGKHGSALAELRPMSTLEALEIENRQLRDSNEWLQERLTASEGNLFDKEMMAEIERLQEMHRKNCKQVRVLLNTGLKFSDEVRTVLDAVEQRSMAAVGGRA